MKQYRSRSGETLYKPSMKQLENAMNNNCGYCLKCGSKAHNVEPDARKYECEHCGATKVYGAEELALMGLYH
jgi:Zn finger protein HypA/HybF involved in hydrogenase expression